METVTREDYVHLKSLLLNQFIDDQKLQKLKNIYKPEINSNRRMDCIHSLVDLINLLEKRACVSERNIKILEEIAVVINHKEYLREMSARHNVSYPCKNEFEFQTPVSNAVLVEHCDTNVTSRIYELILDEIGVKWVNFARALKIRESKMDDIRIKYGYDSKACVREVLDIYTKNVHSRDWKFCLLEALSSARRNDLRRDVEKIFSAYS